MSKYVGKVYRPIGLLGLSSDFGLALIVISTALGALLGGFGALLGKAIFELVESYLKI